MVSFFVCTSIGVRQDQSMLAYYQAMASRLVDAEVLEVQQVKHFAFDVA